jgi:hypothetical protein
METAYCWAAGKIARHAAAGHPALRRFGISDQFREDG